MAMQKVQRSDKKGGSQRPAVKDFYAERKILFEKKCEKVDVKD